MSESSIPLSLLPISLCMPCCPSNLPSSYGLNTMKSCSSAAPRHQNIDIVILICRNVAIQTSRLDASYQTVKIQCVFFRPDCMWVWPCLTNPAVNQRFDRNSSRDQPMSTSIPTKQRQAQYLLPRDDAGHHKAFVLEHHSHHPIEIFSSFPSVSRTSNVQTSHIWGASIPLTSHQPMAIVEIESDSECIMYIIVISWCKTWIVKPWTGTVNLLSDRGSWMESKPQIIQKNLKLCSYAYMPNLVQVLVSTERSQGSHANMHFSGG